MDINELIPGYDEFVNQVKPEIDMPMRTRSLFGSDIEANTPDGRVPNSWIDENGVRKATIWETGLPERCRLVKKKGKWTLVEIGIF
jgi:hypothetical protein